jgi:putative SOS response-associated peptidase YedK
MSNELRRCRVKAVKDVKMATFNARAETVETKQLLRDAFKRTRCLIPLSSYEWQDTASGKQHWYFTARDGSQALTTAGLWDDKTESDELLQRWPVSKRMNSSKAPATMPP